MDYSIQILVGDSRQFNQAHPFVVAPRIPDMVRAAVHSDLIPTLRQALAQLLDAGLKAAVTGWDTPRAEESDAKAHPYTRVLLSRPTVPGFPVSHTPAAGLDTPQ